jgi:hypothetical protein
VGSRFFQADHRERDGVVQRDHRVRRDPLEHAVERVDGIEFP